MKENSIRDRIKEKYTRYINCETDILELTIEEAIFILEKDASVHYVEDLLQEAYKVILSAYKRVLKENEELKKFHIQDNKHLDFIMQHSIPVQKVKDKISERQFELQQEYKDFEDDAILIVLQELLEGRK